MFGKERRRRTATCGENPFQVPNNDSRIITRKTCHIPRTVSVNDFWFPRRLQELHLALLGLIGLFLKKIRLKIGAKKIPTFAGCHLAAHPKSGSCGSKGASVCWYSFCVSWKSLNTHLAFALRKLPCSSVFMVSNHRPVTSFFCLTFLMSMRSKKKVIIHLACDQVADILLFSIFGSHRAKMIRLRLHTCVSPASLFNAHHQSAR